MTARNVIGIPQKDFTILIPSMPPESVKTNATAMSRIPQKNLMPAGGSSDSEASFKDMLERVPTIELAWVTREIAMISSINAFMIVDRGILPNTASVRASAPLA